MIQAMWSKLPKPILVLAPMADVTDAAFRQIIAKYSRPAGPTVFFTEFTSADGLCHPSGHEKLLRELYFVPAEKPIVAQLFSSRPEKMYEAAKMAAELGFDGVDINMGCPDKNIEKQGCGAAMIKNPSLAQELIKAAQEGSGLPVSVKTRIGYNKVEIETWIPKIIEARPALLTVHLRTRKEMSLVPAHWELMPEVKKVVGDSGVLLLGNGDVTDVADAKTKVSEYGIDGVMLGRAIYGNPWLFSEHVPTIEERLTVLVEHSELFAKLFRPGETNNRLFNGHTKSFAIMKKHFKAYVNDFSHAHDLRAKLMETESADQVRALVVDFLNRG